MSATGGPEYSACDKLTRFVVRAPQAVVVKLLELAFDAMRQCRPWFSQGSGPTDDGLFAVTFYAGRRDAVLVRRVLREHGISEVSK